MAIIFYCQAQPKPQLIWAELALLLINPAACPPAYLPAQPSGHPATRSPDQPPTQTAGQTPIEITRNKQNLICKSALIEIEQFFKFLQIEDNLDGR